jgi:hypothetical protein
MSNSSISNSDHTLEKESFKPGKAFYAWVVGFFILNLLVSQLGKKGILIPGLPTEIVNNHVQSASGPNDAWLIGNSILDAAILDAEFKRRSGLQVAKMELGSMTFTAQVALAKYCFENTEARPKGVLFFVSKDDFNLNGMRNRTSQNYLRVLGEPTLADQLTPYLPLALYSASIRKEARRSLGRARLLLRDRVKSPVPSPAPKPDAPVAKKDELSYENALSSGHLAELGQNFELDRKGLEDLAQLVSGFPEIRFIVVFPPVTDGPEAWQDHYYPDKPWPSLKKEIVETLRKSRIETADFSEALPSSKKYFKDFYHLNPLGGEKFTETFADWIPDQLQTPDRAIRPDALQP